MVSDQAVKLPQSFPSSSQQRFFYQNCRTWHGVYYDTHISSPNYNLNPPWIRNKTLLKKQMDLQTHHLKNSYRWTKSEYFKYSGNKSEKNNLRNTTKIL